MYVFQTLILPCSAQVRSQKTAFDIAAYIKSDCVGPYKYVLYEFL